MFEKYFMKPVTIDRYRGSWIGAEIEGYLSWLVEEGYADKPIAEILKEFCSYSDGATMSGKKDPLVNIGGWLSTNDREVFEEARNMVVVYEGLHTYGGMAAHGLNCQAQVVGGGLQAAMNVRQVRVVGHKKNTHARLPGREKRLSAGCLPAGNQD